MQQSVKFVLGMIAALSLYGCAVQKQMVPTGGSRADGTVKLSYEFGMFEVPKIDNEQALVLAKQRCSAWGYTGAEAFGGATKQCTNGSAYSGCNTWMVTVEFQCTGNLQASK